MPKAFYQDRGPIKGHELTRIADRAKRKGLEFDLDMDFLFDLWTLQNSKCALTGWPLELKTHYTDREFTASLDRIDCHRGYTKDNVQWTHRDVNRLKNTFPEARFFEICQAVYKFKPETVKLREGRRPWIRDP